MDYHLKPKDYAKAFKFHYGIRSPFLQWILVILLVSSTWAFAVKLRESFSVLTLALAIAVTICFGQFVFGDLFWTRGIRKQLRQMDKDQVDIQLDFDDVGIRIADDETLTEIPWEKVIKWYGQENLVLLYRHNSLFHIVDLDQLPLERARGLLSRLRSEIKGHSGKMGDRYL